MKRIPVKSTTMRSVGYDIKRKILEIEFVDEEVYEYLDVPVKIYNGLIEAESPGKYLNEVIKSGNYRFEKIT